MQRELVDEAGVTWTEPIPVEGTTVMVAFTNAVTPSAEARVQQVLNEYRDDWTRFLTFVSSTES